MVHGDIRHTASPHAPDSVLDDWRLFHEPEKIQRISSNRRFCNRRRLPKIVRFVYRTIAPRFSALLRVDGHAVSWCVHRAIRIELILSFPAVGVLMAVYFKLAFQHDSPVQNPETLYRQRPLMTLLAVTVVLCVVLLTVRIPVISESFAPTTEILERTTLR